ncbi:hypothetical protein PHMEG_0001408 [Phytophthora megakarya]|uniref:Uncharacterized protein n=1 Tax=Phytophthora megakarya TaxID=4795 RepID=A0A225X198_9STRA|nr:hypothetical protein PHMEG_0001408 [Phytophthora megakarya]
MQKIWDLFSGQVTGRADRIDGEWSVEPHTVAEWSRVMQFKVSKRVVEPTKTAQGWKNWLVKMCGHTVTLAVYEYGLAIATAQDRDQFITECIRPEQTDRAGATAECSLREVVEKLREKWGTTFQAHAAVWRMWANQLTRNLNRSTWDAAVQQPPPDNIANLLRLADSQQEEHLAGVFLRDLAPPPRRAIEDPLLELKTWTMKNMPSKFSLGELRVLEKKYRAIVL